MLIPLTPVLYFITIVIIKNGLRYFPESGSRTELGMSASRTELSSPSNIPLNAVKGAQLGHSLQLPHSILHAADF